MPIVLGVTVVAFAFGSCGVSSVKAQADTVRWYCLAILLLLAISWAIAAPARLGRWFYAVAVAFPVLALMSTLWSVEPRLSFERAVSLSMLIVTGMALCLATATRPGAVRPLLLAIVVAACVVVLSGFVVWIVDPSLAVQAPTNLIPWRFRGLGENPDTVPMLIAIALPLLLSFAGMLTTSRRRRAFAGAFLLFAFALVASGSRGGLLAAGVGGALAAAAVVSSPVRRALAVAGLAAIIVGGTALRESHALASVARSEPQQPAQPSGPAAGSGTHPSRATKPPVIKAPAIMAFPAKRSDEIGNPVVSSQSVNQFGSGRLAVWEDAIRIGEGRPLLGYGFGTEADVFVDRYYRFQGALAENAYIGLFLELGLLGLLSMLALPVVSVLVAAAAWRSSCADERQVTAACAGAVVCGLVLMLTQSFVYSVGNVATVPFWLCSFLLAGMVWRRAPVRFASRRAMWTLRRRVSAES